MKVRFSPRRAVEAVAWVAAIWFLGTWGLAQALQVSAPPDQQLWSPERVKAFSETLQQPGPAALAILRIRRLGVEVAVLEGTDDATLNRGAGHIEDTATPGEDGNAVSRRTATASSVR